MAELVIRPMGGFVGAPGRATIEGRVEEAVLSPADRDAVAALFASPPPITPGLRYRLTREGPTGPETVDAAPHQLPPALVASITARLI